MLALLLMLALAGGCTSYAGWRGQIDAGLNARSLGDTEAARQKFEAALATTENMPGYTKQVPRLYYVLTTISYLADIDVIEGHWSQAEGRVEEFLALWEQNPHPRLRFDPVPTHRLLRKVRAMRGDMEGALAAHRDVITGLRAGGGVPSRAQEEAALGIDLEAAGLHEPAIAAFERSRELDPVAFGDSGVSSVRNLRAYAAALDAMGLAGEAEVARSSAEAMLRESDYVQRVFYGDEFQGIAAYWARERMPLRIRIEPPSPGQVHDSLESVRMVEESALEWVDAVAPGVPDFEFVTEGEHEILVRFVADPHYLRNFAGVCGADAEWDDDPLRRAEVVVVTRVGGVFRPEPVLRTILIHELGHALGLFGHSEFDDDVMFESIVGSDHPRRPTERDLRTLRRLYENPLGQAYRR